MKTTPIENGVFNHELGALRVYAEYTTPLKEEEE
jgi:hypothetical protein